MALSLVVHELGPLSAEAEQKFFDAVFAIAPDHWRVTPSVTLVATEVSTRYLLDHLKEATRRAGVAVPRLLLATPLGPDMAAQGLTAEGEAWVREMRGGGGA